MISTNITAHYNGRYVILTQPTFKVGTYGENFIVGTTDNGSDFSIIRVGSHYWFHCLEGPAYSFNSLNGPRLHLFVVNGILCYIRAMPIDPTLMLYLTLKYVPRLDDSMLYE